MSAGLDGWMLSDIDRTPVYRMFSGEPVGCVSATLTHDNGDTMHVSHLDSDPEGAWAVDAAFRGNGMPMWSHGRGDRTCRKQCLGDDAAAMLSHLRSDA